MRFVQADELFKNTDSYYEMSSKTQDLDMKKKMLSIASGFLETIEKEKLTYDEAIQVLRISEKFLGAEGVVSFPNKQICCPLGLL